jgi:hypothetical protein
MYKTWAFLRPARYCPRVGLSASGFDLGLKGLRVYGQMGVWGVMFRSSEFQRFLEFRLGTFLEFWNLG